MRVLDRIMIRLHVPNYEPYEVSFYTSFDRNRIEFGVDNDKILLKLRKQIVETGEAPSYIEGTLDEYDHDD